MFNTYKFSKQKIISYSFCFVFWLTILMLYHFFKTNFTVFNNVMHRRSFLNVTFFIFQSSFYMWHISILIYLSGDIETNPGPVTNYSQGFKICHWNLNSIPTDNFVKIPHLEAYAITHYLDIICLSETFLDSSYPYDYPRLHLTGYSLLRADHPMNIKRGGVCTYYKEHFPLISKPKLTPLDECLVCELKVGNKTCFITALYRSPSQSLEEFEIFKNGWVNTILNINNSNPFITIFLGDFNARNTLWWSGDIINSEGLELNELSSNYNLHQLINTPTHILPNSESCIDLLFTSQPNLVSESGVHASLFPRCHHQIIYAKVNLKIYYPPPYDRLVWDYSKAELTNIRKSFSQINWYNALKDLNVNDQVEYLSSCILNVFSNFVPNKTESKNILKNYRPISLLPVSGKKFEKCIYNSLYSYLESNDILSKSQSGFRKGDSCISQLLAITHEIYYNFDAYPSLETRGVFLDISKAFDRVWHEGLLYKLKSYGISGPLLILIKSFLANRFQRVVLNGQTSCWKEIIAGVPQGSILGPLFFLIFISDIPEGIKSNIIFFADDTSIFSVMKDSISASITLNEDLHLISKWAYSWKMSFNPDPSKQAAEIVFSKKQSKIQLPALTFNDNILTPSDSHKHLGMILDSKLSLKKHLSEKISKANKGIGIIRRLYKFLPRASLVNIYRAFVRPHLDYGDITYDNSSNATFSQMIESVQYNAALAITGAIHGSSRDKLYEELHDRRWFRKLCFYYKIRHNLCPPYLTELLPIMKTSCYSLRLNRAPTVPNFRTERFKSTFFPSCSSNWNQLDPNIKNSSSIEIFKRALLSFIRPKPANVYRIHHPRGLKLLTRLRLDLSHLREHKFRHNFNDTIDPFCLIT